MSTFQEPGDKSPESRKQREFDDLQNEMAGREVGRQKRFLSADDERSPEGREKKAREEALTRLQMLLNDPVYAKAYRETFDFLRSAETATEAALRKSGVALDDARENLKTLLDKAQRLPNGTRVFRDAKGNVRSEDGRLIEGVERDGIEWKDGAPSYEDYLARKETLEKARRDDEELRRYQIEVLGPARDRMEDQDNPPSAKELEDLQRAIEAQMPRIVKAEMPNAEPPPRAPVADLPIPTLR